MPKSEHVNNYVTKEDAVASQITQGRNICDRCYADWYLHDTPDDGSPVPWLSCVKALRHQLDYERRRANQVEERYKNLQHEMLGRVYQAKSDAAEHARVAQKVWR